MCPLLDLTPKQKKTTPFDELQEYLSSIRDLPITEVPTQVKEVPLDTLLKKAEEEVSILKTPPEELKKEEPSALSKMLDYPGGLVRTALASQIKGISTPEEIMAGGKPLAGQEDISKALAGQAPGTEEYLKRAGVPELPIELSTKDFPLAGMKDLTKSREPVKISGRAILGMLGDVAIDPVTGLAVGAITKGIKGVSALPKILEDLPSLRKTATGALETVKGTEPPKAFFKGGMIDTGLRKLRDAKYILKGIENATHTPTEQLYQGMNKALVDRNKFIQKYGEWYADIQKDIKLAKLTPKRKFDILENIKSDGTIRPGFEMTPLEESIGKRLRSFYDSAHAEGMPNVNKLEFYAPHMRLKTGEFVPSKEWTTTEEGGIINIEPEDVTTSEKLKKITTSGHTKKRTDKLEEAEMLTDLDEATHRYIYSVSTDRFLKPQMKQIAKIVTQLDVSPLGLQKESDYLVNWGKDILGLKSTAEAKKVLTELDIEHSLSKAVDDVTMTKYEPYFKALASSVYPNLMGWRLSTVVRNLMQTPTLAGTDLGYDYTLKGINKAIGMTKLGGKSRKGLIEEMKNAGFNTGIRGEGVDTTMKGEAASIPQKLWNLKTMQDDMSMKWFNWSDNANRAVTYFGGKEKALDAFRKYGNDRVGFAKFLKLNTFDRGEQAILNKAVQTGGIEEFAKQYGKLLTSKYQFDYTKAGTPEIFRSDVGKILGQFTKWPLNFSEILASDIKKGNYGDLFKRLGNAYVLTKALEGATGVEFASINPAVSLALRAPPAIVAAGKALEATGSVLSGKGIEQIYGAMGDATAMEKLKKVIGNTLVEALSPYIPLYGIGRDIIKTVKEPEKYIMGFKKKKKE
jgi:hypothetical protein